MRKSLIIASIMLVGLTSYGQFSKGTFTLGGELGYKHSTLNPNDKSLLYTVNSVSVSPEVGVFFIPNVMTGLLLSYGHTSFKPGNENQNSSGKSIYNNYGGGAFARYYYNYFFAEGRYEMGRYKSEQESIGYNSESKYQNAQFGIGYSLLLGKEIAVEPKLSYKLLKSGESGQDKSNELALTVSIRGFIARNR